MHTSANVSITYSIRDHQKTKINSSDKVNTSVMCGNLIIPDIVEKYNLTKSLFPFHGYK